MIILQSHCTAGEVIHMSVCNLKEPGDDGEADL